MLEKLAPRKLPLNIGIHVPDNLRPAAGARSTGTAAVTEYSEIGILQNIGIPVKSPPHHDAIHMIQGP